MRRATGFTLIELLVVIVIIAVIFGGVLLSAGLSNRDDKKVKEEADRLAALLKLAQEEAVLQSRQYGLSFWREGYGFYVMSQGGWQLVTDDKFFRTRQLPEDMQVELQLEGLDTLLSVTEKFEQPQIFILSSGEVSPFKVQFMLGDDYSETLVIDALGQINPDEQEEQTS